MASKLVFPVIGDLREWGWPEVAAIVIRHAERPSIKTWREVRHVGLTRSGIVACEEMGRQLARYANIRIWHGPVRRCEQTGLVLASGARTAGSTVLEVRSDETLGGSYLIDSDRALTEAGKVGSPSFVRDWFSGRLEPGLMRPVPESTRAHLDLVRAALRQDGLGSRLEVLVTHDWNVMVLREGLLGVRSEDIGWPDFLDGVSFRLRPTGLEARFRDHLLVEGRAIVRQPRGRLRQ
jgi:hypothetical protein